MIRDVKVQLTEKPEKRNFQILKKAFLQNIHIIHILYVCKYFPSLSISYHNFVTTDLNEQEKILKEIYQRKKRKTYGKYNY